MKTKIVIEFYSNDDDNVQTATIKFGRKKYLFIGNKAKSIYNRIKSEIEFIDGISSYFKKKV